MRPGFWEILLIVILVLVLFGHAKIPELAKNVANGINVFKKELKGDEKDKKEEKKPTKQVPAKKPAAKPAKSAAKLKKTVKKK